MEQIKIFSVCFTNKWPDKDEMDKLAQDITDQVNFWIALHPKKITITDLRMDTQSSGTLGWIYITITVLVRYNLEN